jgi:hypothetical protein
MKTQRLGWLAAMLAIVGFVAFSFDAEARIHGDDTQMAAVGKIVSVAEDHSSFELQVGEAEQSRKITVTVTDETVYEIDGEDATAAEVLVVDKRVKVWHTDAVASKVSVMEKGKDKDKHDGHGH